MKKHTYREVVTYLLIALAALVVAGYFWQPRVSRTRIHIKNGQTTVEDLPGDYYGVIYKGPLLTPALVVVLLIICVYLLVKARNK